MKSRMERYYEVDSDTSKRTKKNADLYQKIYETDEYSNIEGIATTLKPNEIDISKIKEMLKNRDDKTRKEKDLKELMKRPVPREVPEPTTLEQDEKNYDIRDILNKAKSERKEEDNHHKLRHTSYDIFENVKKEIPKEEEEEELKELIHTITNTSMLNKLGDQELSLGLLDELKSDTMVGDPSSIKAALEEEKAAMKDDNFLEEDDDKKNMDKTFFTSNMKFKDEDFDELQEMGKNLKKNDTIMNILIFILLVVFATSIIFYFLR
ncbi:MAG: hypothetical protein HFH08_01910 [Bacilli bacterium]|nr:hypothetical protein [Bacilli bacterium]